MPSQPQVSDNESQINFALGKILRYYNLLELNLGLCIRFLENPGEVERSHGWLAKSSVKEKVDRFVELVTNEGLVKDQEELDDWYEAVLDVRCLRNYYVHGTCEHLPLREKATVGFRIPPWRSEEIRGNNVLTMTLKDLETDARAVQSVFERLNQLRRKYGV